MSSPFACAFGAVTATDKAQRSRNAKRFIGHLHEVRRAEGMRRLCGEGPRDVGSPPFRGSHTAPHVEKTNAPRLGGNGASSKKCASAKSRLDRINALKYRAPAPAFKGEVVRIACAV